MHKDFQKYWSRLKRRFNLLLSISVILPVASGTLFLLAIRRVTHLSIPTEFWAVYLLSISGLVLLWNSKIAWTSQQIMNFMHQKYPETEYSLSIFFKKELNALEKWQASKVMKALPKVGDITFPTPLAIGFILLILSGLLYSSSFLYQIPNRVEKRMLPSEKDTNIVRDSGDQQQNKTFEYGLSVYPPRYTNLKSYRWKTGQKIAEGSRLVFENLGELDFKLTWQNQYDFNLAMGGSKSFSMVQSSIFQITYLKNDSVISLKPEILEVISDKPPVLSTNLTENRHELEWQELDQDFRLDLRLKDDYGIASSDIVMTLSRGEGESVRFREMKQAVSGVSKKLREQVVNISLPLDTFDLNPGDELYFYFSAQDNKKPAPNNGRTDVYFLSILDTVQSEPVAYEGFALTNEAEYFKSQRQIIIDTEKLLKDRTTISQEDFEQRSNSIGADQKLLRLRYGVFLGEEYESKGGLGEIDHSGHDHGTVEDENKEEEENASDSHEGHEHESEGNFSNPIFNETPELEAYVHSHNESELSTFLDAEVKAKLKEALANMWEAELFLRTYKPTEALPFEYRALRLIKEVKRASRIYVERMGFEPPPLDEEQKRLTGELDKIDAQTSRDGKEEKLFEEKLFETYSQLESAYQKQDLTGSTELLNAFTDDLVKKITSEPVRYGSLLAAIKEFQSNPFMNELRSILVIMEDMLNLEDLEEGSSVKKMQTGLHKSYYDLNDE